MDTGAISSFNLLGLFLNAHWLVKLVILILILASIWSLAIAIEKLRLYNNMWQSIRTFEEEFWSGRSFEELYSLYENAAYGEIESVFVEAMREWKKSVKIERCSPTGLQLRLDRAIAGAANHIAQRLEDRLPFLASAGASAPFVGLFGTVIGIMASFTSIAMSKNTSLAVVAPGIAEALLATAIGLLVAIPAVLLYNKFLADSNRLMDWVDSFGDEFSSILSRQLDESFMK